MKYLKLFEGSVDSEFTIEMAQEILYYHCEESKDHLDNIYDEFYDIFPNLQLYEASYEEIKKYTKDIFDYAHKSEENEIKLIRIYYNIRKQRFRFPEIYKIEDICIDIIEEKNFSFFVDVSDTNYTIKLCNHNINLKDYIYIFGKIEVITKNLDAPLYKSEIFKLTNGNGYYCDFKIKIYPK